MTNAARKDMAPAFPPRLMTVEQACYYVSLGRTTLRDYGPTPVRFGSRIMYDIIDLNRWVDSMKGKPLTPEQTQAEGLSVEERIARRMQGHG